MSRSRIENKNVIFEKLFFILLHFLVFWGRIFLQNRCVRKVQKCMFLAVFFVSRNSHEKKEHAVELAMFSSRQYAGLIHFARKIPIHCVRIASGGIKIQKTYHFCRFWVEWAENIRFFAHSTQKLQKPFVFCIFMPPDAAHPTTGGSTGC